MERWIELLGRVHAEEMPPRKSEQPSLEEREEFNAQLRQTMLAWADAARDSSVAEVRHQAGMARTAAAPPVVRPFIRRVTRSEYRRSVRDLFDAEFDLDEMLPPDDPGNGFDVASDGLSLSPLAVERFVDAAEMVARVVAPDESAWRRAWTFEGAALERRGAGSLAEGAQVLWANGRIGVAWSAPVDGRYLVRVRAWGMQAGSEPVQLALELDGGRRVDTIEVPNEHDDPKVIEHICKLRAGARRFDVRFLNDFWNPQHPDPRQRDRNAAVDSIEIEGPLDPPPWPAALLALTGHEPGAADIEAFVRASASRAYRSTIDIAAARELLSVAGEGASLRAQLQGAIAAMLASPRFLLRADATLPRGAGAAARLAGFLWSSVPDDALLGAADQGRLMTPEDLAREARRMLRDPRSRALAEEFATQWLGIRELGRRMPDPTRFPEVDAALLTSMREETIRCFDSILRERRPVRQLVDAEWTFMDERLLRHLAVDAAAASEPVDERGWRRVRVESGGVLRQPSVLVATSNPTRTSPVKRGRFVLEALLDEAPPPPPPGVPQLPPEAEMPDASLAAMLERHRADPSCAACHRSMDSIGLLLERFDAVGRPRGVDGAVAELPDGRSVRNPAELATAVLEDGALVRTLARRLMVYATGRSLDPSARRACDRVALELGADASLEELVVRLVQLDCFLTAPGAQP